jgi:uncharacterized protein (DUF433 family)
MEEIQREQRPMGIVITSKQQNGSVGTESLVQGFKWIVIHPRYVGGKAAILGKRITVAQILEDFAAGWTEEDYETEFDVPKEAVVEALLYAAQIVG